MKLVTVLLSIMLTTSFCAQPIALPGLKTIQENPYATVGCVSGCIAGVELLSVHEEYCTVVPPHQRTWKRWYTFLKQKLNPLSSKAWKERPFLNGAVSVTALILGKSFYTWLNSGQRVANPAHIAAAAHAQNAAAVAMAAPRGAHHAVDHGAAVLSVAHAHHHDDDAGEDHRPSGAAQQAHRDEGVVRHVRELAPAAHRPAPARSALRGARPPVGGDAAPRPGIRINPEAAAVHHIGDSIRRSGVAPVAALAAQTAAEIANVVRALPPEEQAPTLDAMFSTDPRLIALTPEAAIRLRTDIEAQLVPDGEAPRGGAGRALTAAPRGGAGAEADDTPPAEFSNEQLEAYRPALTAIVRSNGNPAERGAAVSDLLNEIAYGKPRDADQPADFGDPELADAVCNYFAQKLRLSHECMVWKIQYETNRINNMIDYAAQQAAYHQFLAHILRSFREDERPAVQAWISNLVHFIDMPQAATEALIQERFTFLIKTNMERHPTGSHESLMNDTLATDPYYKDLSDEVKGRLRALGIVLIADAPTAEPAAPAVEPAHNGAAALAAAHAADEPATHAAVLPGAVVAVAHAAPPPPAPAQPAKRTDAEERALAAQRAVALKRRIAATPLA